ncbi:MAG: hypothetical protein EPN85_09470 [Bacteroidetes bacterium]|nr:MAG: hypothetical protein EPN85_09470 [Bacteroidota bacterium]
MDFQELNKLTEKFESLNLDKVLNFEQFNRIAIVHHSSAMEGSTLTLEETTLLITEGIMQVGLKSMLLWIIATTLRSWLLKQPKITILPIS